MHKINILCNEKKKDLAIDNRGNQAAPLLLSNKGRYVWSDEAFAFEFKDSILIVHSDFEKIEPVASGKTLREAYIGGMNKHFPPSGKKYKGGQTVKIEVPLERLAYFTKQK